MPSPSRVLKTQSKIVVVFQRLAQTVLRDHEIGREHTDEQRHTNESGIRLHQFSRLQRAVDNRKHRRHNHHRNNEVVFRVELEGSARRQGSCNGIATAGAMRVLHAQRVATPAAGGLCFELLFLVLRLGFQLVLWLSFQLVLWPGFQFILWFMFH
jgi:hypothetical protein